MVDQTGPTVLWDVVAARRGLFEVQAVNLICPFCTPHRWTYLALQSKSWRETLNRKKTKTIISPYVCVLVCASMHTSSLISVRVCISNSVPVYADQCVGIFSLRLSVSHHNNPNRAQRASFSLYSGRWSLEPQLSSRICITVPPQCKSFYIGSV